MRASAVIRARINALLHELRSWELGEQRYSLNELVEKFELDSFIVSRIATSEGLRLQIEVVVDPEADPEAPTLDLDPDAIERALEKPDPNPDWVDQDKPTGVWHRTPSGRWVLTKKEE